MQYGANRIQPQLAIKMQVLSKVESRSRSLPPGSVFDNVGPTKSRPPVKSDLPTNSLFEDYLRIFLLELPLDQKFRELRHNLPGDLFHNLLGKMLNRTPRDGVNHFRRQLLGRNFG
jgi:hypothetical protein